jgi:hypothetical protein
MFLNTTSKFKKENMKPNFNYLRLLLLSVITLSLGSCLKNNRFYNDFTKYERSIEMPKAASAGNQPFTIPLNTQNPDTTTEYKVYVNVASVDDQNTEYTASIGLDQAYIDQLNAEGAADNPDFRPYEVLPDSLWSLDKTELTIPAGERQAFANLTMFTGKMPTGHNYVLPFMITSASPDINISSWNHFVLKLVSSIYSGVFPGYHVDIIHNGAPLGSFDDPGMTLFTKSELSVTQPSIGDYFGGYTQYDFKDDGTIAVKAGTSSDSPDAYGASVKESSYDPDTKSFYVKFTILGGAYVFTETFNR